MRQPLAGLVMQRCVALADICKNVGEVVGQILLTETVTSHKRSAKALNHSLHDQNSYLQNRLGSNNGLAHRSDTGLLSFQQAIH